MGAGLGNLERIKNNLALVCGVAGLAFGVAGYARTPTSAALSSAMPYEGFLEENGTPVSGIRDVAFELYDAPTLGQQVWGPETHVAVPFAAGVFSVMLGDTVDMVNTALAGNRWLQVSVGGVPLNGRQLLGSAPFARRGAPGQDFHVDGDAVVAGTTAAGAVATPSIAIANKWRLADTGDAWLRLHDSAGGTYYGGVAADDFYANQSVNAATLTSRGGLNVASTAALAGALTVAGNISAPAGAGGLYCLRATGCQWEGSFGCGGSMTCSAGRVLMGFRDGTSCGVTDMGYCCQLAISTACP